MNCYIFLTTGGTTVDGAGFDVENCQMVGKACGETALDAFNALEIAGHFDEVFCYQLATDEIKGHFACLVNIPAECEDRECGEYACLLTDDEKRDIDCPHVGE